MGDVQRCHNVSETQGRRANQEIFERDTDASARLFALNLPGDLSDLKRYGMDHQVAAKFFRECLSALTVGWAPGTVDAMSQFDDGHGREARFGLAL